MHWSQVVVTEVVDANEFYVQRVGEPRVAWIAEQLRAVAQADPPAIPVRGCLCAWGWGWEGGSAVWPPSRSFSPDFTAA